LFTRNGGKGLNCYQEARCSGGHLIEAMYPAPYRTRPRARVVRERGCVYRLRVEKSKGREAIHRMYVEYQAQIEAT
jgi:hypothetical protein